MDKSVKKYESATEESIHKKRKLIVNENVLSENKIQFSGNHFKKLIKGEHPLGALRQLLAVIKYTGNTDVINEYFECGGNANDLIIVLDKIESKTYYHHYQPIFSVLSLIIIKSRDEFSKELPTTEAACRRVLRSHTPILHAMLANSSTQVHKKVVLEMLTAMVTLNEQLAREVLSCLSLREVTMNDLAKHPVKYELNSTRAIFMRFVLAFFYHDASYLIKQLLEQRNLLQCLILAGLTNDDSSLLSVFLSTLKEKIVDNTTLSKTTKLKMFNTKIMIKLLEAYTWTGPKPGKKSDFKVTNSNEVGKEDKEEVICRLHQLLVVLCTNHKFGVAFVDPTIGLDTKNYNELVFSVIKSMDPYWNVNWVRDLALRTVISCPDLIAPTFRHFGLQGYFLPEVSTSFVNTCKFAKEVVDSLVPERCLLTTGSPDQLTHLTVRTVFNMNVLSCVQASLASVHPTLRLLAVELLNSIFQTLQRFISFVKTLFVDTPKNFVDYKQILFDHITKNLRVEEELMVAWGLGVGGDQSVLKVPSASEYFLPLVDLLLSYHQVFPMYLPPVFLTKLRSTLLDTTDVDTKNLFSIKIIKFILFFKNVHPSQMDFDDMVRTLVPLLSKNYEAKLVLKSLFLQTGYFEGLESEVDIWVTNLTQFPSCDHHLPMLLSALKEVISKPKSCMKALEKANSVLGGVVFEEFHWAELTEVATNQLTAVTSWEKMLPESRISILMVALVRVLKSSTNDIICNCSFVPHLLGDILFSQVNQRAFSEVINMCSSPLLEPIKQYASKWNNSSKSPQKILKRQPFQKKSLEYQMITLLSTDSFTDDNPLTFLGTEDIESEVVLLLVRLVVFHLVQSVESVSLHRCTILIHALLALLPEPSPQRQASLEEVFLHPSVLHQFRPLESTSQKNLTPLVFSLIPLVENDLQKLIKPYKLRFLDQVHKALKKGKPAKSPDLLQLCEKLLTEGKDVTCLLSSLVESESRLEYWADLTCTLLTLATRLKCSLPGEVVTVLSRRTSFQSQLQEYLTMFPHLIKYIDVDFVTAKGEHLNKLCYLLLKFDFDGNVQKKLLKNNKKQVSVILHALAAAGPWADSALWKQGTFMVDSVILSLSFNPLPEWLNQSIPAFQQFINQVSDEQCEGLLNSLATDQTWTCSHLEIARIVYSKLKREVDFVTKALPLLITLTTPTLLSSAESACDCLASSVNAVGKGERDWEPVRNSDDWFHWTRLALKLGETVDSEASFLLTTLNTLCAIFYTEDSKGVSCLTEMVMSHSQFLSVMLAKHSLSKNALLQLLLTLLQLDSSAIKSTHIPIFLSAYSASLSFSDQLLLKLLQLYESQGESLSQWRPVLFGETAASFYSVRSKIVPGLWNKQNFYQLLDLFDEHKINVTISNYPIHRGLKPKNSAKEQPDIYDPAFYLPMFVSIFAPSEIIYTYRTCQSGCFSLILSALSSHHKDVRTIAFVTLQRFYCHLLSNTNNQDSLWLHFLDALRGGLSRVSGEDEVTRLSSVVTVFLARTALVLTNPSHPLFIPLSQYVLAKPHFQLDTVPEFLPIFNSVDVHLQSTHQEWIVNVLLDGMRDMDDFLLCLNGMVFKIILEYYSSTLAPDKLKVQILEVLRAAVSVGDGSLLVSGYSLYPWLHSAVRDPELSEVLVQPLIGVLGSFLHKSSAAHLIPLLLHLTSRPQLSHDQLTAVLQAVAPYPLSREEVHNLLGVTDSVLGEVFEHKMMLENGVRYVEGCLNEKDNARGYLRTIIFKLLSEDS